MNNFVTLMHLLTPLHTGGSADEGNLMGIAREVHTDFPYLPASSLRGKIRAQVTSICGDKAELFFGQKIKDGQQPTEGEVWFADSTLLFFPIASLSHHLVWITCPLWIERCDRWLNGSPLYSLVQDCRAKLKSKSAVISFEPEVIYLQTAIIKNTEWEKIDVSPLINAIKSVLSQDSISSQLSEKLIILSDEDCIALVETGLQREVKVALNENEKTVKDGSFRSQEAIPPEAIMFFPWGMKPLKQETKEVRDKLQAVLNETIQFGGLEGLGRGWSNLQTINTASGEKA